MPRKSPVDIIEGYRRGQQRRLPFTLADVITVLIIIAMLLVVGYFTFIEKPELPTWLKLNTLTPTLACECLPPTTGLTTTPGIPGVESAATGIATLTLTPTAAPSQTPTETLAPTSTPTETATPTETLTPTITPVPTFDYTVQEGDTLSTIADRFGFTVAEILAVNDLQDPSFIYVGQIIKIPIK